MQCGRHQHSWIWLVWGGTKWCELRRWCENPSLLHSWWDKRRKHPSKVSGTALGTHVRSTGSMMSPVLPAFSKLLLSQLICHLKISVYVNQPRFHTGISPCVPSWYWSSFSFMFDALLVTVEFIKCTFAFADASLWRHIKKIALKDSSMFIFVTLFCVSELFTQIVTL